MDMSIIVPCHNLEPYITPLLVSLRLQDIGNYEVEVIFVCDNCNDNTKTIIEQFKFDYLIKHIIECNVQSCGLARNEGMKIAKGKYIWFIDGDDWIIDNRAIFKIINFMNETRFKVIRFGYECPPTFRYKGYFSMVWQYAYRKNFIKYTPFVKMQPSEDVVFQKKVVKKLGTKDIPVLKENLYYYNYMRPGSNMYQYRKTRKIEQ